MQPPPADIFPSARPDLSPPTRFPPASRQASRPPAIHPFPVVQPEFRPPPPAPPVLWPPPHPFPLLPVWNGSPGVPPSPGQFSRRPQRPLVSRKQFSRRRQSAHSELPPVGNPLLQLKALSATADELVGTGSRVPQSKTGVSRVENCQNEQFNFGVQPKANPPFPPPATLSDQVKYPSKIRSLSAGKRLAEQSAEGPPPSPPSPPIFREPVGQPPARNPARPAQTPPYPAKILRLTDRPNCAPIFSSQNEPSHPALVREESESPPTPSSPAPTFRGETALKQYGSKRPNLRIPFLAGSIVCLIILTVALCFGSKEAPAFVSGPPPVHSSRVHSQKIHSQQNTQAQKSTVFFGWSRKLEGEGKRQDHSSSREIWYLPSHPFDPGVDNLSASPALLPRHDQRPKVNFKIKFDLQFPVELCSQQRTHFFDQSFGKIADRSQYFEIGNDSGTFPSATVSFPSSGSPPFEYFVDFSRTAPIQAACTYFAAPCSVGSPQSRAS